MLNKAPRLKSTIKTKMRSNKNVRAAAEALIELVTQAFLSSLAEKAKTKAFEEKSASIKPQHLKAISKKALKEARG